MTIQKFTTGGLATALLIGLGGSVLVFGAGGQRANVDRAGQYGASLDARQHGYEDSYRVGADRGRQDRESRTGYNLKSDDYQIGARYYESAFGSRSQYMSGYRDGYKSGYDDGYNDVAGKYGQLYGRPDAANQAPARNDVYAGRSWDSGRMAFDVGYRDGVTSGQQDHGSNVRSNFRDASSYQSADLGYRASDGDRNAYRLQFRDGFERGYQDGYGRTQYATDGGGYFPTSGRAGAVDTRDGQGASERSVTVEGNRQWTPTNIRVTQGDTFWFQTTGEVRFTPNADGRAGAAGSLSRKYETGAPLPNAFAGALIGRIDNGRPFGIGDQTSLVMPASGILYIGVNDDNVRDNTGQFQVVISW